MSSEYPHTAKAVYFACMDDRQLEAKTAFKQELSKKHGACFDPTLAGGALMFLLPEWSEHALKQIELAYAISQVTDAYVEVHLGCGGYEVLGGRKFESRAEEISEKFADLDKITEAISGLNLPITVHTRLVDEVGSLVKREDTLTA